MGKVGAKKKGYIKNLNTLKTMKFQYNPESFQYSRGATYSEIVAPGMPYPEIQFIRGNSRSFSVDLFLFDKPSTDLIDNQREFLEALLPPETNDGKYTVPPKFLFVYGNFVKKCVLEDLSVKIDEYDTIGKPTMAHFTLTIRQVES